MAGELARITPERVQVELSKTLLQDSPARGAGAVRRRPAWPTSVLPELSALRMEIDEHHQHKDVYAHSLTVLEQAIALEKADRTRRPRTWCCGWRRCCTTSASRPPGGTSRAGGSPSTTTRWSGRSW